MDAALKSESGPNSATGSHGFGLSSMTERARIIGGTLKIESSPGAGTTIIISLPLT
jgi:signal transduction histidine kinase